MSETVAAYEVTQRLELWSQIFFVILIVSIIAIFLLIFHILFKASKKIERKGKNKPIYVKKWFIVIISFLLTVGVVVILGFIMKFLIEMI